MAKAQPLRSIGEVSAERIQGRAWESDWAQLPAEETTGRGGLDTRAPGSGPDGSPGEGVRWPMVPVVAGFASILLSFALTFAPLFLLGVALILAGMVWSGVRSQSWIARGVGTGRRKKLSGYGSQIRRRSS